MEAMSLLMSSWLGQQCQGGNGSAHLLVARVLASVLAIASGMLARLGARWPSGRRYSAAFINLRLSKNVQVLNVDDHLIRALTIRVVVVVMFMLVLLVILGVVRHLRRTRLDGLRWVLLLVLSPAWRTIGRGSN